MTRLPLCCLLLLPILCQLSLGPLSGGSGFKSWGQSLLAAARQLSQSHPLLQTPALLGEDPRQHLHHHPFAVGKAGATDMALAVPCQLYRIKPTLAFLGAPLSSP